jgi:uncharacterized membrane protein
MDADQQCLSAEAGAEVQCKNAETQGDCQVTGPETQAPSLPHSKVARRWTVIASGLLLLALALVVIYTGPNAFYSPVALVVVSAIGLAALLLQVRFRQDLPIHSPLWLNVLGILCATASLFSDYLRIKGGTLDLVAFTAVVCFGISGTLILYAVRRRVRAPQSPEIE